MSLGEEPVVSREPWEVPLPLDLGGLIRDIAVQPNLPWMQDDGVTPSMLNSYF